MTITLCPTKHFQGASHIAPDAVAANRDLATQLREIQTDVNAASATDVIQTAAIAAIVDDHVNCVCAGIDPKNVNAEISAALSGDVAKHFMPTHVAIEVTAVNGVVAADCTMNVGVATGGATVASALACTGLTTLGAIRIHPIAATTLTILGNATLFANVQVAATGAGTATYKVTIIGRQF
jgi:hypothetical protein